LICLFAFIQANDSAEFSQAQQQYMSAIMSGDSTKEASALKSLIYYGKRLHINTNKYKKALGSIKINTAKNKASIKYKPKPVLKKYSKYNIKSIKVVDDEIIVLFNHKISKKDFSFFEKKKGRTYYDIFNIKGNFKNALTTQIKLKNVDRVIINQYNHNALKISLRNKKNLNTKYAIIGNKLIITLNTAPSIITRSYNNHNKERIIVLDAGHGGEDSGASHRGKKEKYVTLSIAHYLRKELMANGYKVYLTRNKDKFIKLDKRTKYANIVNANIFVSIHANAVAKKRWKYAQGLEVYFLSPARSKRAKNVAKLENNYAINSMDKKMQNVFLNILNQPKITQSNKLAIDVQSNMLYRLKNKYGTKNVIDGGVREGPFWVLVGAQMPSILIEVGYITHPIEGRRITTRAYQKLIAKAIAEGIDAYFEKNNL